MDDKLTTQVVEKLSEREIEEKILEFCMDSSYEKLKAYYETPTTWEFTCQARKETSHTQFLSHFFASKDFCKHGNNGPVKNLILLLLKWAGRQSVEFDRQLAESIYSQKFVIESYQVNAEYPICVKEGKDGKSAYGDGNIDILIRCKAKLNDVERNVNIVIENKISSPETKKGNLCQTDAYYQFFTEEEEIKDDINLFMYLKPTSCDLEEIEEAECQCKHFIWINYQELLDNILQPVSEQEGISSACQFILKDYIKALGRPSVVSNDDCVTTKEISIMATEQKERKLLISFFQNNEDLIRAAINALGDKQLTESMNNLPKSGCKRVYTINGIGSYSMYEVLEKFIKTRLEASDTVEEINKLIQGYVGGNRIYLSDNRSIPVIREDLHYGTISFNGREIRYTKEWAGSEINHNFTKFRMGVSERYKDFVIAPVDVY